MLTWLLVLLSVVALAAVAGWLVDVMEQRERRALARRQMRRIVHDYERQRRRA